jgi:hypothetical protein
MRAARLITAVMTRTIYRFGKFRCATIMMPVRSELITTVFFLPRLTPEAAATYMRLKFRTREDASMEERAETSIGKKALKPLPFSVCAFISLGVSME